MNNSERIIEALRITNTKKSEIARLLGCTHQNICQKLKRNTLTDHEIEIIVNHIGGKYVAYIELQDGTRI